MKQGFQILVLLLVIIAYTSCEKRSNDLIYDKQYIDEIKAARNKMSYYLAINSIPGASIAISKNGKLIYSEGMGKASVELDVPVSRSTKFRIAELSELFTSFIFLQMVEEGKLHPDSSIQHYFPDFPEKEYRLNLSNLVQQTAGFREPNLKEIDQRAFNVSIQKGLEQFKDDPLTSSPGLYQDPNMFNYNLLGAIMEKTTGKRFNKILESYVTDTLNLTNTVIDNPFKTIKGRTHYFDHNLVAQVVNATTRDLRYCAPSQGLLSTSEDLVKFAHAVLHSDLLSEKTKKTMFEPIPLFDGIPSSMSHGWLLLVDKWNNDAYGKSGSITGGNASILIYPSQDLIIACTTNLNLSINDSPVFDIAEEFFAKPEKNTGEEQIQKK